MCHRFAQCEGIHLLSRDKHVWFGLVMCVAYATCLAAGGPLSPLGDLAVPRLFCNTSTGII
jgi:hypothetical protein